MRCTGPCTLRPGLSALYIVRVTGEKIIDAFANADCPGLVYRRRTRGGCLHSIPGITRSPVRRCVGLQGRQRHTSAANHFLVLLALYSSLMTLTTIETTNPCKGKLMVGCTLPRGLPKRLLSGAFCTSRWLLNVSTHQTRASASTMTGNLRYYNKSRGAAAGLPDHAEDTVVACVIAVC